MLYGIDVGGTKIEIAIFDDNLKRQDGWRVDTPKDCYRDFIDAIISLIAQADQRVEQPAKAIGIGMIGIVDDNGNCVSSNLPCVNGMSLVEDLTRSLVRPVAIDSDMNTFALSESLGGAGAGIDMVLGAIVGTGTGSGLVVKEQIYKGRSGIAGEWGHVPISATLVQRYQLPLRACGCGGFGCAETYIAGPGLLWLGQHCGGQFVDNPELIAALRRGDERAEKAFAIYLDCLAGSLAQAILHYDPGVIVIGGGVSNIREIFHRLPALIETHLLPGMSVPALKRPRFGDASGVRGAAIMAQQLCQKTAR